MYLPGADDAASAGWNENDLLVYSRHTMACTQVSSVPLVSKYYLHSNHKEWCISEALHTRPGAHVQGKPMLTHALVNLEFMAAAQGPSCETLSSLQFMLVLHLLKQFLVHTDHQHQACQTPSRWLCPLYNFFPLHTVRAQPRHPMRITAWHCSTTPAAVQF